MGEWRKIPEHKPGSKFVKAFGYFSASVGFVTVFAIAGLGVASAANAQYEPSTTYIQKEAFSDDVLLSDRKGEPDTVSRDRGDERKEEKTTEVKQEKKREEPATAPMDIPIEPGDEVFEASVEEVVEDDAEEVWVEPETVEEPSEEGYSEEESEDAGTSSHYSGEQFKFEGRVSEGKHEYTWYSENVLPGDGLDIPGRYVDDEGYVRDGDGNLCVASNGYSYGTVLDVPFGDGRAVVYDSCEDEGDELVDVYVSW